MSNIAGEDSSYFDGRYRETVWQLAPDGRFHILYSPTMQVERGPGHRDDFTGMTSSEQWNIPAFSLLNR